MALRIVADENIPLARDAFGAFGDVVLLPGVFVSPEGASAVLSGAF